MAIIWERLNISPTDRMNFWVSSGTVLFRQPIRFSNSTEEMPAIHNTLISVGWPAIL